MSTLEIECDSVARDIVAFIRKVTKDAGVNGAVVGLSGGGDSSLVARLLVEALGSNNVLGVLMPTDFTPKEDTGDALTLAKQLGIRSEIIEIQSIFQSFMSSLDQDRQSSRGKITLANLRSRIRMVVLYYFANLYDYLVAGTGDRSEDLIGYFTKYGDGGVDFLPISHLYKTQVRKLAEFLGVPENIAHKPSSPQLYPGHRATDEIPLDYDRLDTVEKMLFDEKLDPVQVSIKSGVGIEVVKEVLRRYNLTGHKRVYPAMLGHW